MFHHVPVTKTHTSKNCVVDSVYFYCINCSVCLRCTKNTHTQHTDAHKKKYKERDNAYKNTHPPLLISIFSLLHNTHSSVPHKSDNLSGVVVVLSYLSSVSQKRRKTGRSRWRLWWLSSSTVTSHFCTLGSMRASSYFRWNARTERQENMTPSQNQGQDGQGENRVDKNGQSEDRANLTRMQAESRHDASTPMLTA